MLVPSTINRHELCESCSNGIFLALKLDIDCASKLVPCLTRSNSSTLALMAAIRDCLVALVISPFFVRLLIWAMIMLRPYPIVLAI